eukprot:5025024-Pleurochrysis_carterae.AAC.4
MDECLKPGLPLILVEALESHQEALNRSCPKQIRIHFWRENITRAKDVPWALIQDGQSMLVCCCCRWRVRKFFVCYDSARWEGRRRNGLDACRYGSEGKNCLKSSLERWDQILQKLPSLCAFASVVFNWPIVAAGTTARGDGQLERRGRDAEALAAGYETVERDRACRASSSVPALL